jgi:hypothetical protein
LWARRRGDAFFPISDSIYIEAAKIGPHRQRRHLRDVVEELSGYAVVTARHVIAEHEVEALLDEFVGRSRDPINPMDYLDWGVARAFGMVGGFRVKQRAAEGREIDVTDQTRSDWPDGPAAFDRLLAEGELALQRAMIEGPSPSSEPDLRAQGWDPRSAIAVATKRAAQEIEQVARFDADHRWRAGRIRDVVAARELLIEINEILSRGLAARGAGLDDIFGSLELTRGRVDAMPSFDVAITIKTEYHRDALHKWTTNDIHDIDALGSTVPYCDVVVTDAAAAAQINRAGLAERLGTRVIAKLPELVDLLDPASPSW